MKKCKWLLALVLSMVMMLTACGGNTIEGEWTGKWYVGDFIAEGMGSEYAEYANCFDDVYILVDLEISEDEIEMSINKDCKDDVRESLETAMADFVVIYMSDLAEQYDVDMETFYAYMGYEDEADMIDDFLASADVDGMVDDLFEDLETQTYEYEVDDDVLKVEDEDGEKDKWEFELDGKTLVIKMTMDDVEVEIEFERQ